MKLTCRLCQHSHEGFKKTAEGKLCRYANKLATHESEACEFFICDGGFFCPYLKHWVHIATCKRAAKNCRSNRKPCKHCEYATNADIIMMLMENAPTTTLRRR